MGGRGGLSGEDLPNSPTPSSEDSDGKPISMMGQRLSVEFMVSGDCSAARKTGSLS